MVENRRAVVVPIYSTNECSTWEKKVVKHLCKKP